ncbi:uncharacterized [Tachysurus ichikawai]
MGCHARENTAMQQLAEHRTTRLILALSLPLWADWALKCQRRLGIQAVFGVAEGLMVNSLRSSQLTAPGDESVLMQEEQCQLLLTECTHSCHSITLDDLTICPPGGPLA